jgi:hypothetical protein
VPCPTGEVIVARACAHGIIAGTSVDNIISGTAIDHIISNAAADSVVAGTAIDRIVTGTSINLVIPAASADVLELRGGQSVTGAVLKEDGDALYIDLGVEVVRIPKERVLARSAADAADHASTSCPSRVSSGLPTACPASPTRKTVARTRSGGLSGIGSKVGRVVTEPAHAERRVASTGVRSERDTGVRSRW